MKALPLIAQGPEPLALTLSKVLYWHLADGTGPRIRA